MRGGDAGRLTGEGAHFFDPREPQPGPHFRVNLLLGDRTEAYAPLLTTPKSVVDGLGGGSFRAHSNVQVLAARWDYCPEEHGFPANRQFYLVEAGRQIFFSGNLRDRNLADVHVMHGVNHSRFQYRTRCGLEIEKTVWILPFHEGEPSACEATSIVVRNQGRRARRLALAYTAMFGFPRPDALREDVMYTALVQYPEVKTRPDGTVLYVRPVYTPSWGKEHFPFQASWLTQGKRILHPTEYSTSYARFVGNGTLVEPESLARLGNVRERRGPVFCALKTPFTLRAGEKVNSHHLAGYYSPIDRSARDEADFRRKVIRFLAKIKRPGALSVRWTESLERFEKFFSLIRIRSDEPEFDSFVNRNLPFQVLYQTFASRSFSLTQKWYREIGFREVQDLFASMPYFLAAGRRKLVRQLLAEWIAHVHAAGYADHQFFWQGRQPGHCSDNALWLVQAIHRYVALSGDVGFLCRKFPVAGSDKRRALFDTLLAIVDYSGRFSVGRHGLPLLDKADWNDTLQFDLFLDGPAKDRLRAAGKRLPRDLSESVMNAFLLKIALDQTAGLAARLGEKATARRLEKESRALARRIDHSSWKKDFYARVLFNRPGLKYRYLGAAGDGLAGDPKLRGGYFLNSFSWSVLAGVADERKIRAMFAVLKKALWTEAGWKLCAPVKFERVSQRESSGQYRLGDRENGGVFKHANMMCACALFRAARRVADPRLARELAAYGWRTIEKALPFRTLRDPYRFAGNPRFCTQYNNSVTGEHIGPELSGTAPWLWLALMEGWGVRIERGAVRLDRPLASERRELAFRWRGRGSVLTLGV